MNEFPDDEEAPKPVFSAEEIQAMRRELGAKHTEDFIASLRERIAYMDSFSTQNAHRFEDGISRLVMIMVFGMKGDIRAVLQKLLESLPPAASSQEYLWREHLQALIDEEGGSERFQPLLMEIYGGI